MKGQRFVTSVILVAILSSIITYLSLTPKSIKSQPTSLNTVNSKGYSSDNLSKYLSFQIKYPSNYFVTSDDMVTSYKSQGGMAPPRLILAKKQLLDVNYYEDLQKMNKANDNCILIESTIGFTSPEDWRHEVIFNGKDVTILSEEKVEGRKGEIIYHKISVDGEDKFESFIKMPEDISYYFHTCGNKNKADFETVLKNFDIRGIIE